MSSFNNIPFLFPAYSLFPRKRMQTCSLFSIFVTNDKTVKAIDSLTLILSSLEGACIQANGIMRTTRVQKVRLVKSGA